MVHLCEGVLACSCANPLLDLLDGSVVVYKVAREELEELVHQHHGDGELEYGHPLGERQGSDLEDEGEEGHVKDHEMEGEREEDSSEKVGVLPRRHRQQRLVLGYTVDSVKHLDGYKYTEGHGHGVGITEDLTIESFVHLIVRVAGHVVRQLVVSKTRSSGIGDEPPGSTADSCKSNVESDCHITEEQPASNQTFFRVPGGNSHDVGIGSVEAESSSRQTVSDEVDPQELDRDEGFGESKSGR